MVCRDKRFGFHLQNIHIECLIDYPMLYRQAFHIEREKMAAAPRINYHLTLDLRRS